MRLRWRDIVTLTAFPCFIALGQILFRATALQTKGRPFASALRLFVTLPSFYGALGIYAVGTLMWVWLLSRYSLTLAYPFAALALVVVPLLEAFFFGTHTGLAYWAGLALIVSGVLLITRSQIVDCEPS